MGNRSAAAACAAVVALGLAVSACGSSSKTSTTASSTAGNRRAQIAACLKKQGITPPQRPSGTGTGRGPGPGFGFGFGGRPSNPQRSKFQAALRKCGITFRPGGGRFTRSPAVRAALTRFAACVRKNGYNLPAPNLSGNGPVFNPKQVDRSNPKFQAAARKCQSLLPPPRQGAAGGGGGAA